MPLAGIHRVKPLSLLRDETEGTGATASRRLWARVDPLQAIAAVVVLVLFAGLAAWQAGSFRVGAFVSSDTAFTQQPQVANGASEFLLELFGEAGRHVRAAVGVNTLPLDAAVEVEFIFIAK